MGAAPGGEWWGWQLASTVTDKKVSGRELRRAYKAHAEDLKAFTTAASTDLVTLMNDLKATRELCADLSVRLEKAEADVVQVKGALILFITQPAADRATWLQGHTE